MGLACSDSARQRRVSPTRRREADVSDAGGKNCESRQVQPFWEDAAAVHAYQENDGDEQHYRAQDSCYDQKDRDRDGGG